MKRSFGGDANVPQDGAATDVTMTELIVSN
jgi:hypothetical protein